MNETDLPAPTIAAILWRRLDRPGHEAAHLAQQSNGWQLSGAAVFTHDSYPCRLDYQVECDSAWQTSAARVSGWVGEETIELEISVDAARRWWVNGEQRPEVEGSIDIDLNFSPSTNLLPIRRLQLGIGESAEVKAAWLRFPSFTLEPLDQIYRRISADTYRYQSAGGSFVRDLKVNAAGFVTDYPGFWTAEVAF